MQVKIDTKEKFHVITVHEPVLSADMTGNLYNILVGYLQNDVSNVIVNLQHVQQIDNQIAEMLVKIQQKYYEAGHSFVFCQVQPAVEEFLDNESLLEIMNITPSESEAWDIVQMEEIERELLGGDEI